MKTVLISSLLLISSLTLHGCGASSESPAKNTAATPAAQADGTASATADGAAPTLSPDQMAAFKDSLSKKPKKGAKSDE